MLLLFVLAKRREWTAPSRELGRAIFAIAVACAVLGLAVIAAERWGQGMLPAALPWRPQVLIVLVAAAGALAYGATLLAGLRLMRVPLRRV